MTLCWFQNTMVINCYRNHRFAQNGKSVEDPWVCNTDSDRLSLNFNKAVRFEVCERHLWSGKKCHVHLLFTTICINIYIQKQNLYGSSLLYTFESDLWIKKKFHKYCLRISAVISTSKKRNLCDRFMLFACAWDLWVEQFYRGFRYFMAFEVKEEKINTKILNNIFIHKIHHSLLNSSQEIYDFLYDFGKFRNFENVYDVAYERQFQLDTCFSWYFRELETKID